VSKELPGEPCSGLKMRYTVKEDGEVMRKWFDEPDILRWFPMVEPAEIDDSVGRWISFCRYECSLTAMIDDEMVGIATLYLQPYRKLLHQTEFGIIVSPEFRGRGIGTDLLRNLFNLARTRFKIEVLHLQVYEGNPAIKLYERFGFKEFGFQSKWLKELDGSYRGRSFMEVEL
jgi:RimJ/RimL family protein N-acetyltransferase